MQSKKNYLLLFCLFCVLSISRIYAQGIDFCGSLPPHTASNTEEPILFDRFGNTYNVEDIRIDNLINTGIEEGGHHCDDSGYFQLFFDNNISESLRPTICQVFKDIANDLIQRPEGQFYECGEEAPVNPVRVVIRIDETIPNTSTILGAATSYYSSSGNPCIETAISNMNYAINGGSSFFGPNTAAGIIDLKGQVNWNLDWTLNVIPQNTHDLYSVILHEALHLLGYGSGINFTNGLDFFVTGYDNLLYFNGANGFNPVLEKGCDNNCNHLSMDFQNFQELSDRVVNNCLNGNNQVAIGSQPFAAIAGGFGIIPTGQTDLETNIDFRQYISHLNPNCPSMPNDDFIMQRTIDMGVVRRKVTEIEKRILCELNYNVIGFCESEHLLPYSDGGSLFFDSYECNCCTEGQIFTCIEETINIKDLNLTCNDFSTSNIEVIDFGLAENILSGLAQFVQINGNDISFTQAGAYSFYYTIIDENCNTLDGRINIDVGLCLDCEEEPLCENLACLSEFEDFPPEYHNIQAELGPWYYNLSGTNNSPHVCGNDDNGYLSLATTNLESDTWTESIAIELKESIPPDCTFDVSFEAAGQGSIFSVFDPLPPPPVRLNVFVSEFYPCDPCTGPNNFGINVSTDCGNYIFDPIYLGVVNITNVSSDMTLCPSNQNFLLYDDFQNISLPNNDSPINYLIFQPQIVDFATFGWAQTRVLLDDIAVTTDCIILDPSFTYEFDCPITTFTAAGTVNDVIHQWEFGDGNTATGANISHTYADNGTYTVVHTVVDDCGNVETETQVVVVDCEVNNFEPSFTFNINCPFVEFTATGTIDGVTHEWDFGNGNIGTGTNVSHLYENGTYTVTYTITDAFGQEASVVQEITIECPTVDLCGGQGATITESMFLSEVVASGLLLDPSMAFTAPQNLLLGDGVTLTMDAVNGFQFYDFIPGSEIVMGEGAQIIVPKNFSLIIRGTHIHGCDHLHKGILMEEESYLYMAEFSKIEDAEYGIQIEEDASVGVFDCIFRKNYIGIFSNIPNNGGSTNFDLTIHGTDFNCVDVNLLPTYSGQTTPAGTVSYAGIDLSSRHIQSIGLRDAERNTFRDLCNGIITNETFVILRNNEFKNILPYNQAYQLKGSAVLTLNRRIIATNNHIQNCISGFRITNCTSGIAENIIEDVDTGIHQQTTFTDFVEISNNDIRVAEQEVSLNRAAVFISATNGLIGMNINNNDIVLNEDSPLTLHRGIWVDGAGISQNLNIRYNDLDLFGGQGITILAANDALVQANNLYFRDGRTSTGISCQGTNNSDFICNEIDGLYVQGSNVTNQFGIDVRNSMDISFYCNRLSETAIGISFDGDCIGMNLSETKFNNHYRGMVLNQNTDFGGVQDHHGNQWRGWYDNLAAVNLVPQAFIDFTKFEVHTIVGTVYHPVVASAPGDWFSFDPTGSPSNLCNITQGWCPPAAIPPTNGNPQYASAIVEGTLTYPNFQEARQWQAKRYLYQKMLEGELESGETALNAFQLEAQNGNIGELFELEEIKKGLLQLSTQELNQLNQYEAEYEPLLGQLYALEHQLIQKYNHQEWQRVTNDKASLLAALAEKMAIVDDFKEQLKEKQAETINTLLMQSESLSNKEIYEANYRNVHQIHLQNLLAGSSYLEQETPLLLSIANQCPLAGGQAVYLARSLMRMVQPDLVWEDDESCSNDLENRKVEEIAEIANTINNQIKIYPNPSKAEFNVILPDHKAQYQLRILDALGKEQLLLKADQGGRLTIPTTDWKSGVYWLQVFSEGNYFGLQRIVLME